MNAETTNSHDTNAPAFTAALHTARRLLKIRPRSEHELRRRLEQKGVPAAVVESVLVYLKHTGELDDTLFARAWTEQRLRRGWGLRRIRYELKQKGISPDVMTAVLSKEQDGVESTETVERLVRILTQRKDLYEGLSRDKMRVRLYHYALRRGHDPSHIIEALKKIC